MKSITITIENLRNGNIRATGRHNGRTVAWKDGKSISAGTLLAEVMTKTCSAHRVGEGYDLTHIELNDAAKACLISSLRKQFGNPIDDKSECATCHSHPTTIWASLNNDGDWIGLCALCIVDRAPCLVEAP